jgi:hypothetical protein
MSELKMIIVPSETGTKVWGRNATRTLKLHATLPAEPIHPAALPRLLEAVGSFLPVRAALVVPSRVPSCATKLYPEWWVDVGGGSYELQVIAGSKRERLEWWGR